MALILIDRQVEQQSEREWIQVLCSSWHQLWLHWLKKIDDCTCSHFLLYGNEVFMMPLNIYGKSPKFKTAHRYGYPSICVSGFYWSHCQGALVIAFRFAYFYGFISCSSRSSLCLREVPRKTSSEKLWRCGSLAKLIDEQFWAQLGKKGKQKITKKM